jgi:hypothetical protein
MNTLPLKIQGATFEAKVVYHTGHHLTELEAEALNGLLHENLRNNFAAKIKKSETPLTQADFEAYESTYAFGKRVGVTKSTRDPVEKEERALAKEAILASYAKKGIKPRSVNADTLDAYITRAVESGKFRALAEENVARAASIPEVELDLSDFDAVANDEAAPAPKAKREKKAA